MALQLLRVFRPAVARKIIGRRTAQITGLQQWAADHLGDVAGADANKHVGAIFRRIDQAIADRHAELQLWVLRQKSRERRGDMHAAEHRGYLDPQRPSWLFKIARHVVFQPVKLLQNFLRGAIATLPGAGQREAPG